MKTSMQTINGTEKFGIHSINDGWGPLGPGLLGPSSFITMNSLLFSAIYSLHASFHSVL